ncbi:MAG TPA: TVP38/TMEM64 family protein [Methylomirabilota bacterium]|nr:TVP38/TMEM64 family protein [Methylomirabilota bacterium]
MPPPQAGTSTSQKILRGGGVMLALATFLLALRWINNTGLLRRALDWIQELGPWGPVAFVVIYVAAVIAFLPAVILTVGGGFIFGLAWGSVYVLLAATIAGNATFLIARHLARDWIARRFEAQPRFKALDDAVAREGWKIVALVRLAPVFPFGFTSYAFGLTRLPLWEYFLANFTMIPGTVMYVYFGAVARDLTDKIATPPWIKWTIGAITVVVVLYVTRFAKRALAQKVS